MLFKEITDRIFGQRGALSGDAAPARTQVGTKRNAIEAPIRALPRQVAAAKADLASVTAVLVLYGPPAGTAARFPAYAHLNWLFSYGEMFRLSKAALQIIRKPPTTRDIALAVIRTKGWGAGDAVLCRAVAYRPIQTLTRAAMLGRIVELSVGAIALI